MSALTSICEILRSTSGQLKNYKLKQVATGILHIDRAHELTKCLYKGKPIPKHLHYAPTMPCHYAFAHRFGIQELPEADLIASLTPPSYTPVRNEKQEHFYLIGSEFIQKSAEDHVKRYYPKLFNSAYRLAVQTFTWEKNLSVLASLFGIENALINVIGLQEPLPKTAEDLASRIKTLVLPRQSRKNISTDTESKKVDYGMIKSQAFTSLIGACLENFGSERTVKFLAGRLFSGYFDPKKLIRSKNPALDLSKFVLKHENEKICFRLLGESGRKSHNSMYVVGVYVGKSTKKLGEGYGASVYMAQQRASLDALRKVQLD